MIVCAHSDWTHFFVKSCMKQNHLETRFSVFELAIFSSAMKFWSHLPGWIWSADVKSLWCTTYDAACSMSEMLNKSESRIYLRGTRLQLRWLKQARNLTCVVLRWAIMFQCILNYIQSLEHLYARDVTSGRLRQLQRHRRWGHGTSGSTLTSCLPVAVCIYSDISQSAHTTHVVHNVNWVLKSRTVKARSSM